MCTFSLERIPGQGYTTIMSSLSLKNISKSFGSVRVVADVSIDVASGEFFSLLGPSGCGKSTLLRIIAGLEVADTGTVTVDGTPVDSVPPQQRGIGMVFQQYALWPHMTIAQNVRFGLETQVLTNKERDSRMLAALERVQMTDYKQRYPHQISGGQQQRVALARALAMQPSIILLDEPLSNLDARLRAEIRQELAELHQSLGTTMIYVTHDQEDALSLSSRIAIMNRGAIEQIGTPQDVYRDPASPFCARFIGDANLVPCSLANRPADQAATVAINGVADRSFHVRLSPAYKGDSQKGHLCVRPSAITVAIPSTQGPLKDNTLSARVTRSSYKGAEYDVEVMTDDGLRIRGSCRDSHIATQLQAGAAVEISWLAEDSVFIGD